MLDFAWKMARNTPKPNLNSPLLGIAARNAWDLSFGDGIAPVERTPSELIFEGHHRDLYRFAGTGTGRPVLLVPPLAAPAQCFDLRPGQSLAAHLSDQGHATYVVDYGEMHYSDRHLGFEYWTEDVLPEAIRRVSDAHDGADVDLIGWSLGGTLALLTAASHPELPIRSLTALGTPIDYSETYFEPLRALGKVISERPVTAFTWALGGVPAPLVQVGFRLTALQRELTKPWFVARNLHETEALARMEAVDRFQSQMPGYPARLFHQMSAQLVLDNALKQGSATVGGRRIELATVSVPVLAIGSPDDTLAPAASVAYAPKALTGSPRVRYETVRGSHLGLVAGPNARETSWAHIDSFFEETALPAEASAV